MIPPFKKYNEDREHLPTVRFRILIRPVGALGRKEKVLQQYFVREGSAYLDTPDGYWEDVPFEIVQSQ